jgi:hypothetical protein
MMGFLGLSWQEKVSSRAAPGSGWSAGDYNRAFSLLYETYKAAVTKDGFSYYSKPKPDAKLYSYMVSKTGIDFQKIVSFLNGLFDAAKAGEIKPEYLNPAQGQVIQSIKTAETIKAVQNFLAPGTAAVTGGPVSSIMNKILVAGVALGLGYLLLPKLIKGMK